MISIRALTLSHRVSEAPGDIRDGSSQLLVRPRQLSHTSLPSRKQWVTPVRLSDMTDMGYLTKDFLIPPTRSPTNAVCAATHLSLAKFLPAPSFTSYRKDSSSLKWKPMCLKYCLGTVRRGMSKRAIEMLQEGIPDMGEYAFINSKDLITKDVEELRKSVQEIREQTGSGGRTGNDAGVGVVSQRKRQRVKDEPLENGHQVEEVSPDKVMSLRGHTSEVFICAWSPAEDLLASGLVLPLEIERVLDMRVPRSGDSSARIWDLGRGAMHNGEHRILNHYGVEGSDESSKSKDVTSMDWSPDGKKLATGSYDGLARIWSKTGELLTTFRNHHGPIFSLKWNSRGTSLLSGSVDKKAYVWDAETGEVCQSCEYHSGFLG